MNRRNFLKASTLTAGATLFPNVLAQAHTAQGQDLRMLPMNRGWRFSPKIVEGDTSREFDQDTPSDKDSRRIGFRDAHFTPIMSTQRNSSLVSTLRPAPRPVLKRWGAEHWSYGGPLCPQSGY